MKAASPSDAAERTIGQNRTSESDWRRWLDELAPPVLDGIPGRLVVVAPHPDDELLGCGGLIQSHVAAGGLLTVVAVTDGEASHPGDAAWPPIALAAERRAESIRGLQAIGAGGAEAVRLGLPDGDVASRADELHARLSALIRPDDLVLTTWRLDGHPDHEATGAQCARVARERGARLLEAPVWMWHWSAPDDLRIPWHRLRAVALDDAARQAKQRALGQHATQLARQRGGSVGPILDAAILARAERPCEYFFV